MYISLIQLYVKQTRSKCLKIITQFDIQISMGQSPKGTCLQINNYT